VIEQNKHCSFSVSLSISLASLRSTHNNNNNNNNKTKIGTQHIETSKTDLRENFQGSLQPSPVTDDLELTYTQNSSSRFLGCMSRRSATNIVWFIIYGFSIAAVVGVYMVLHNDGNVGITESIRLYAMYQFYLSVAMKLTDWENHRTKTGHERSLVLKVFSFAFVNSYISLLYIAFFDCNNPNATYEKESGGMDIIVLNENSTSISPCIRNLSEKTFSLLTFTNLVVNPFVEIGVPYILYKFDSSFKNFCCHCCRCLCCKRSRSDARTCNVIKESELQEYVSYFAKIALNLSLSLSLYLSICTYAITNSQKISFEQICRHRSSGRLYGYHQSTRFRCIILFRSTSDSDTRTRLRIHGVSS